MKEWLKARPEGVRIGQQLERILEEGFDINPLNNVNIHAKLESLLRGEYQYSNKQ